MTKKCFLVSLIASYFLVSCSDDNYETSVVVGKSPTSATSNRTTSQDSNTTYPVVVYVGEPSESNLGESANISVNSTYGYFDDYNVYSGDSNYSTATPDCLGDGKPCINLSHFLGSSGAYIKPNPDPLTSQGKLALYFGENEESSFRGHPTPKGVSYYSVELRSFYINENGSSSPLFNYSGYMTNDAANSVLHQFKSMVSTIPNDQQGKPPKIFAAHFAYNSWFTTPVTRQAKMSVRYYY